ncbi:MAG: phosphonate ABC transporter ATP-binding protein [Candidatus Limnocylindria bacterium]
MTLEVDEVWFSYVPGRPVVRGVGLEAAAGKLTMILGMSGSGKTTLLKVCKGLLSPQRGTVRVLGSPVLAPRRGVLDPSVAYIPQQLGLVRAMSALENAAMGAMARLPRLPSIVGLLPEEEVRRARGTLARLGIGHKADAPVHGLSGGERQRVAIARALMQRPRVILADEFVSQLDPLTSVEIVRIVREIADEGVAVLMTTHELDLVRDFADRVVVLRDGEKVLDVTGRPEPAAITAALRL